MPSPTDVNDPSEFLVDARDAKFARGLLHSLAPQVSSVDEESPALGLTRWQLSGVAAAADALRAGQPGLIAEAGADGQPDSELLLRLVRHVARRDHHGWCPVIDRDRTYTEVYSESHIKHNALPELLKRPPTPDELVGEGTPDGPLVGLADARLYAHPHLAGRYLGRPLTTGDPNYGWAPRHATFVAGTILRRAPSARLICHPVLDHPEPCDSGEDGLNKAWSVAKKLMRFLDEDVTVVNMSFGCQAWAPPLALQRAVQRLSVRMVLVASAGNNGADVPYHPVYPGAFPEVTAVGAIDPEGIAPPATPNRPWVDALALGIDCAGPTLPGAPVGSNSSGRESDPVASSEGYAYWSGSSFAAANFTGEIARLMATEGLDAFAARDRVLADGIAGLPSFTAWYA